MKFPPPDPIRTLDPVPPLYNNRVSSLNLAILQILIIRSSKRNNRYEKTIYIYIYTHRHCWWVCMEVSDWRRKTSVDVAIVSRKWCPDTVPGSRSNTPRSFSRRNWPSRIHRSLDNCSRLLARFASPTPTVSTVTFLILFQIYIYWFIKNHVLRGAIISPKKEDETNVLGITGSKR